MNDELLTRSEAAALLRVSMPTIDRMRRAGDLPYLKTKRAVRIERDALMALVRRNESGADHGTR